VQLRVSVLRRLIREAAKAVYGWPTSAIEHVYGVPDRMADSHPTDLGGGDLKLPKGPNSRDDADDRPLDRDEAPVFSYGKARGVSTTNKSNNASGTSR
jgi:hypothetical protein